MLNEKKALTTFQLIDLIIKFYKLLALESAVFSWSPPLVQPSARIVLTWEIQAFQVSTLPQAHFHTLFQNAQVVKNELFLVLKPPGDEQFAGTIPRYLL